MKETEIIRYLLDHKDDEINIMSLANAIGMDYKNTYNIVTRLLDSKIISLNKFGASQKVMLTNKVSPLLFKAEYERREKATKDKKVNIIYTHLKKLNFPYIALLFGSYAKGTKDKHSDIDILTISQNEKEIRSTLGLLSLNIHLTALSPDEFMQMARSKEFSVVSEAMKHNIILIGIEEYYRVMENA